MDEKEGKLRKTAWDNSFHSFGMGYIFNKRAQRYSMYVNLLKVFGIVTPVAVGATAMGYGFDSEILKLSVTIAIPLSIIQLVFSVLAVVFKWDQELAYAYEASQDHSLISEEFKKLGNIPQDNLNILEKNIEVLEARYLSRNGQDAKHSIKEWELRKGMRYALREFQKECVACKCKPHSMESTYCDVCGKFSGLFEKGVKRWTKKRS